MAKFQVTLPIQNSTIQTFGWLQVLIWMLGTSQRSFPKGQLPMGIFPSSNFPSLSYPERLASIACSSRSALPQLQPAMPQRALTNLWEAAVLEIAHFGNCTFGKLPLGKLSLGKSPWENSLGKIPNT